jgi:septum formation protein
MEMYLNSGEWEGRAGGYAVQGLGASFVVRVEGDLSNVIGLPIPLLLSVAPELLGAR